MAERAEVRGRIIAAAADLLSHKGRDAVTTRSVSAAAGVQPPTIYRLFGDMRGLLEAVAADGFGRYLAQKATQAVTDDPVNDLRAGWDLHVRFGLENPAHYLLMYGAPGEGEPHGAAAEAMARLRRLVRRVAEAGRLCVDVERAAEMMHSACMGVTFTLIGTPAERRDLTLSTQLREAVIAAVTVTADTPADREPARRAVALRAVLDDAPVEFSAGERILLGELLERIARSGDAAPAAGDS